MNETQLHELLFELLETELGGVLVYEAALRCVHNEDLRGEWEKYHDETKHHVELAEEIIRGFGLDPSTETPGRRGRAPHRQVISQSHGTGLVGGQTQRGASRCRGMRHLS